MVALRVVVSSYCVRPRRDVPPTGQSLFFASPKKRNQKKGDPRRRSALGADCSAVLGLCGSGRTHYAACGRCVQTAARSQRLMRAARAPQSPVLLSSSEGGDNTSRPRCARLDRASRRCEARRDTMPKASLLLGPLVSRRAAQGFAAVRVSAPQRLTSRRLFERSERSERSEFGAAAKTEQRKAALAQRGPRRLGSLLCPLSCRYKKVGRPPGRTPGAASRSGQEQRQSAQGFDTPARASRGAQPSWIPAFAGMTPPP